MASWDRRDYHRTNRFDLALALCLLLLLVGALVVVGTVEGSSLNPDTDCKWGEVRTAGGTCR